MKTLFLSAGEVSGDMHGAHLARALQALHPGIHLVGVGGPRMAAAGVELVADVTAHSAVGLVEQLPHVLPVMMGSVVDFPNFDPIFHNAFSSYNGQIFDVGLYPPGTSRAVRFSKPGVVRVFCNIHPTMSAVVLVLPTPYFTTTGRDGSYKLAVPPGSYELSVFHERATEQTLQALTQRVLVTEEGVTVSPISVSESGFLSVPHKNKYNKEYGPPSDDKIIYPGVRN